MTTNGIYIYGIVPNFYGADMFRSLENSGVYAIPFQNISAIVSDSESAPFDSLDRESLGYLLVHHQKTIEDLMGKGFNMIIPMRLGTIDSSREDVLKILENGHDLIIDTLNKIQYLTEIDLAVTWADFSGTLKDIAKHPDIIAMKDNLMKNIDKLSQDDQMKVGMLVQAKLKEKNTKVELNILDSLSPICLDIKTHEVMNDQMVTNSAFLINRNKKEKFEQVIDQLDEEYKGLLNFKLVGPLPCYSFYTIEVKELNPENVAQAKIELGLREESSESEIKKAYLEKAKLFHPDAHPDNGDEENFKRINKAYLTLLDYSAAAKQSLKEEHISLAKERVIENLILVKIKE
ncbi:MAG: GvpL/GvpF family gas vesicle protein [Bacteroidales bacterium]